MRPAFFAAFGLLCLQPLGCSDEGCPDKHARIDGSCVVYTGIGVNSLGGAPGAGTGGSSSLGAAAGAATASPAQGGKGGVPAQGGSAPASSGAGGTSGAPVSHEAEAGAATGGAPMTEAGFGASCATHVDCGGATDYCAAPPTEPFYCTASGCDQTPSLCPTGYECLDLGLFAPGEPFVCVKSVEVGNGAFGDVCETSADCRGETDYCAFSPTEPPYCSASGCDSAPELCPANWLCFDVGQFVSGEPFVCVKPVP